jgi:hypothetical protein
MSHCCTGTKVTNRLIKLSFKLGLVPTRLQALPTVVLVYDLYVEKEVELIKMPTNARPAEQNFGTHVRCAARSPTSSGSNTERTQSPT